MSGIRGGDAARVNIGIEGRGGHVAGVFGVAQRAVIGAYHAACVNRDVSGHAELIHFLFHRFFGGFRRDGDVTRIHAVVDGAVVVENYPRRVGRPHRVGGGLRYRGGVCRIEHSAVCLVLRDYARAVRGIELNDGILRYRAVGD